MLVRLRDLAAVEEIDCRRAALPVARRMWLRIRQHADTCGRASDARKPGTRRARQLAVLVFLGILTDVPDSPNAILGLEGQLGFLQLPVVDVSLEDDERADPVDRLRQVGDGGHDAVLVQRAVVCLAPNPAARCWYPVRAAATYCRSWDARGSVRRRTVRSACTWEWLYLPPGSPASWPRRRAEPPQGAAAPRAAPISADHRRELTIGRPFCVSLRWRLLAGPRCGGGDGRSAGRARERRRD